MEEIFTSQAIVDLMSSLPKRSPRQQLQLWNSQKEQRRRTSGILLSLGRQITQQQAKRLDELNLSFPALCNIRAAYKVDSDFDKALLQQGVRSKSLREKLASSVPKNT